MSKKRQAENDAALMAAQGRPVDAALALVPVPGATQWPSTGEAIKPTLGAALESLGTPKQAIAAIEARLDAPSAEANAYRSAARVYTAPNEPTLASLADDINARFKSADECDTQVKALGIMAEDHRVAAGKMLVAVKDRLAKAALSTKAEGFQKWCERNIKRSKTDIWRCMQLVKSDDPAKQAEAREKEKTVARASMAASRARNSVPNVGNAAKAKIDAAEAKPDPKIWAEQTAGKPIVDEWKADVPGSLFKADQVAKIMRSLALQFATENQLAGEAYAKRDVKALGAALQRAIDYAAKFVADHKKGF